jgi:hypothetical protein
MCGINQRVSGSSPEGGAKADQKWSAFLYSKYPASINVLQRIRLTCKEDRK